MIVGVFHTPDSYSSMLPLDVLWLIPKYGCTNKFLIFLFRLASW